MKMSNIFLPFEKTETKTRLGLVLFWIVSVVLTWVIMSAGKKHLFPSPQQVWDGMKSLVQEGLFFHIFASLGLCLKATLIALLFSLIISYLSPIPLIKPIASFLSRLRYLPLTGLTFFAAILIKDARSMQVWILVVFMSLYFITSLMAVINDIPQEEFDHARSLKCSRWEMLWEVIIKGRFDYVLDVLRQNLAIIWMMLVSVESILVASGGLGVLIKNSDKFMNHGRIIALQIVILVIGLLIDLFLTQQRKMFFRYSKF
jgi:ABC-type nitrate/sulfonate/bicarbonate transport system permease component